MHIKASTPTLNLSILEIFLNLYYKKKFAPIFESFFRSNQLVIHNMKTFYRSFKNFKENYFPKDIFQIIIEKTLHFLIRSGIYSRAVSTQVNKIFLPK